MNRSGAIKIKTDKSVSLTRNSVGTNYGVAKVNNILAKQSAGGQLRSSNSVMKAPRSPADFNLMTSVESS